MAREQKELRGVDRELASMFEAICADIDFSQEWPEIRDQVLEAASNCLDAYEKYKQETVEKVPSIKPYHFNTIDRRVFLAFDYEKKRRVAKEAEEMFRLGTFTSPEEQKRKLKKLLEQAAMLQKSLGIGGQLNLAELLG